MFGLKTPIHAPNILPFWGIWPYMWGAVSTIPPKGTYLRGNRVFWLFYVKVGAAVLAVGSGGKFAIQFKKTRLRKSNSSAPK